jgi:hypothetical protein
MAGKIVASINALGLFTSTGNLLITQANSIATAAIEDGAVTNAKLTLAANASNIKTALNASGDAPIYACRAWVNFNGTGTVAIRGSGNVSSITDNGTGDYTVNFTTAMPDTNYAITGLAQRSSSLGTSPFIKTGGTYSTTACDVTIFDPNSFSAHDPTIAAFAVFR